MYGLIIENVLGYLRSHFHPKRYEEVKKVAKFPYDEASHILIVVNKNISTFFKKQNIDRYRQSVPGRAHSQASKERSSSVANHRE